MVDLRARVTVVGETGVPCVRPEVGDLARFEEGKDVFVRISFNLPGHPSPDRGDVLDPGLGLGFECIRPGT